jgi:hypothetical protein
VGSENGNVFNSKSSGCKAKPPGVVGGQKKLAAITMYCGGGIDDNAFRQQSKEE